MKNCIVASLLVLSKNSFERVSKIEIHYFDFSTNFSEIFQCSLPFFMEYYELYIERARSGKTRTAKSVAPTVTSPKKSNDDHFNFNLYVVLSRRNFGILEI